MSQVINLYLTYALSLYQWNLSPILFRVFCTPKCLAVILSCEWEKTGFWRDLWTFICPIGLSELSLYHKQYKIPSCNSIDFHLCQYNLSSCPTWEISDHKGCLSLVCFQPIIWCCCSICYLLFGLPWYHLMILSHGKEEFQSPYYYSRFRLIE